MEVNEREVGQVVRRIVKKRNCVRRNYKIGTDWIEKEREVESRSDRETVC